MNVMGDIEHSPAELVEALRQFHVSSIPDHMILAGVEDVAWVAMKWAEQRNAGAVAALEAIRVVLGGDYDGSDYDVMLDRIEDVVDGVLGGQ